MIRQFCLGVDERAAIYEALDVAARVVNGQAKLSRCPSEQAALCERVAAWDALGRVFRSATAGQLLVDEAAPTEAAAGEAVEVPHD